MDQRSALDPDGHFREAARCPDAAQPAGQPAAARASADQSCAPGGGRRSRRTTLAGECPAILIEREARSVGWDGVPLLLPPGILCSLEPGDRGFILRSIFELAFANGAPGYRKKAQRSNGARSSCLPVLMVGNGFPEARRRGAAKATNPSLLRCKPMVPHPWGLKYATRSVRETGISADVLLPAPAPGGVKRSS